MNVVHEARNDTYKRLAKLAGSVGLEESKVFELLEISDKPGEGGSLNTGNKVTSDVKLMVKVSCLAGVSGKQVPNELANKANRRVGVHVTPTVLFNVSGRLSKF